MNGYAKRYLVFKSMQSAIGDDGRALKGVATVSVSGGETEIELCVYNLDSNSAREIKAVVYVYGEFYAFNPEIRKRTLFKIEKTDDLSGKILVLLTSATGEPLGYASLSGGEELIKEGELYAKKVERQTDKVDGEEPPRNELFTQKSSGEHAYDDYRIATENYYRLDDAKLIYEKNERIQNRDCEEEKTGEDIGGFKFDEANFDYYKSGDYYLSVKNKLENLICINPAEEALNNAVPGGKFAKISYDKTRRYALGTISIGGTVKFVCYGVPVNRKDPTPRLKNAKFIPLNPFDLYGYGYYVVFKDAKSGRTV